MDIDHNNGRARGRKRFIGRALGSASFLTLALAAMAPGTASAAPAVFFNDDTAAGLQTFIDTVLAADASLSPVQMAAMTSSSKRSVWEAL